MTQLLLSRLSYLLAKERYLPIINLLTRTKRNGDFTNSLINFNMFYFRKPFELAQPKDNVSFRITDN